MERLEQVAGPFRILSIDGGGSLGVYTLGVLIELEKAIGGRLCDRFDLIYGTSTGSIIGSLLAMGRSACDVYDLYLEVAPAVMGQRRARGRTLHLTRQAESLFGSRNFDCMETRLGIVATDLETNGPMVFKSSADIAHGRKESFIPGFGCTVAQAVLASCAAYPLFKKQALETSVGTKVLVDGGFCANNPGLLALTDAIGPLEISRGRIRLLSLGTGKYPLKQGIIHKIGIIQTLTTLLTANAATIEWFRRLLFDDLATVRIDDAFASDTYRTNFLEADPSKLKTLHNLGRRSFGDREVQILALMRQ